MGNKISQAEFEIRVDELSDGRFSLVSEYNGKNAPILLKCNKHNITFEGKGDWFCHGNDVRGNCPICTKERREKRLLMGRRTVKCALCGKDITKSRSRFRSKSGEYFCCRKCKDVAQSKASGEVFKKIRPKHYGSCDEATPSTYRQFAFQHYPPMCSICKILKDPSELEVHHIDEDRSHNKLDNLIILCPNHHKQLTTHKYILEGRDAIVPVRPEN